MKETIKYILWCKVRGLKANKCRNLTKYVGWLNEN